MFVKLAQLVYRLRIPVLMIFGVLFVAGAVLSGGVFKALKPGGYDDPSTESYRVSRLLIDRFQVGAADVVPLYTAAGGTINDERNAAAVKAVLDKVGQDPAVERVLSFYNTGAPQFISKDQRRTFAVISLKGDDQAKIDATNRLEAALRVDGQGIQSELGGAIPVFEAFNHTIEKDLQRAELIAFPITAVLLVIIFGSLVAAGVPLLLGALAIVLALTTLRLIATITNVSVFALNVVTVLGLGLAIDYSLFILNRYREELPERGVEGAIITAVSTTGRAVAFSGVTLAASLVGLFLFPQMFLRSLAVGGIAVTVVAVIIATTLLPALLAVLGPRIDALRLPWLSRSDEDKGESGFWHRLAFAVMRRPALIAVVVVAFLLLLGSPFLRLRPAKQDHRALAPTVEARHVSDVLDSEFLPHETSPHNIVLTARDNVLTKETIGALYDYSRQVAALPGITRVDSLFSVLPGQSREQYQELFSKPLGEQNPLVAGGIALFAKDNLTRLSAVSAYEIDDQRALEQVARLRALAPPANTTAQVGGSTADLQDTKDSIRGRVPYTLLLIGVVTFVVLFLVFGSITLPVKAMIMNVLSLTASYGAIVFIFQDGRFENILRYHSLGTIDVSLPILMFAIVFGLSMDYEVLMLSRVREEFNRTGDNTLAVARGLEKTGRLITSAAALLVVVIAAFATSSITLMKSLGVGMALAIAIDATIVRALLVPAAMRLMGASNWWAPAPLKRLWERIGLGDLEGHGATPALTPLAVGAGAGGHGVPAPAVAAAAPSYTGRPYPNVPMPGAAAPPLTAGGPPVAPAAVPSAPPMPAFAGVMAGGPAGPPLHDGRTVAIPRFAPPLGYLIEREGQNAGRTVQVPEKGLSIGRESSNDLVLTDPAASSRHARIDSDGAGGFVLTDLDSTNGTVVGTDRVSGSWPLQEDQAIRIGTSVFVFKRAEERLAAPPPPSGMPASGVARTLVLRRPSRSLAYLIETAGEQPGRVFPLQQDLISLGRDPRNTVVLSDPSVSGFHARVERGLDGGFAVEDRGSRNGTLVNGQLLTAVHALAENDLVEIGATRFQFKLVEG